MIAREVHDAVKQTIPMLPRHRACRGQNGFTLLEIIITIVIAAIMGVLFAQFVYTGVIHSADPLRQVQNMSTATHIMEYMTANYKSLAATQSNFLATFKDYVDNGNKLIAIKIGFRAYHKKGLFKPPVGISRITINSVSTMITPKILSWFFLALV